MSALYPISGPSALLWLEGAREQFHLGSKALEASNSSKGMKRDQVLLADDDLGMLAATARLLHVDFDVVDTVRDGEALLEEALQLKPDVIHR